ncbi:hypothetical protein JOB18_005866 [Solea senegalensis]|uniref:Reverse transcriptase domain-containing protein n=1 Tax=Solea senegalensis TaxID=28829 RepID=A0AAV6PV98_SOLSE|nr:hypothetical protein JOB18_005866 [Solea senegalensis]
MNHPVISNSSAKKLIPDHRCHVGPRSAVNLTGGLIYLEAPELHHKEIKENSSSPQTKRQPLQRQEAARTSKLHKLRILELQYADDCALVSHTPEDLQAVLNAAGWVFGNVYIEETAVVWRSTTIQHHLELDTTWLEFLQFTDAPQLVRDELSN